MSLLELHQISKSHGDGGGSVRALEDVDVAVGEGHLIAVMGPSRSGNSTLLTIAGSVEAEATSCDVVAGGMSLQTISRNDKARLRRRTIGHCPDQLSGGERRRVASARSVVAERKVLHPDGPPGAFDSTNGEAVRRSVLDASKRSVALVVATHGAHLTSWADRVIFLRDGRATSDLADSSLAAPSA